MTNDKTAFNFRLSNTLNEYVTEEAARLGMSKNTFLQFLIVTYRKEQEQNDLVSSKVAEAMKKQLINS